MPQPKNPSRCLSGNVARASRPPWERRHSCRCDEAQRASPPNHANRANRATLRVVQRSGDRRSRATSCLRHFTQLAFFVLALVAFATPFAARADVTRNVSMQDNALAAVSLRAPISEWDGRGFVPVEINIENRSGKPRRFEFDLAAQYDYRHATLSQVALEVPAHGVRAQVVYVGSGLVSLHNRYSRVQATVTVCGAGIQSGRQEESLATHNSNSAPKVAVSPALEREVGAARAAAGDDFYLEPVNAATWPADWRVFSAFDCVLLTKREHDALDAARRAALREWVALGGQLLVYPGKNDASARPVAPDDEPVGLGHIRHPGAPFATDTAKGLELVKRSTVAPPPDLWSANGLDDTSVEYRLERPLQGGWLSLVLLAFGVVVGPVNLWVFAPAGKRQRLFLTVPLISLAAALLLSVFIVVRDGFGGHGARRALVRLLPGVHRATVYQEQFARTGVLAGGDFPLADDVAMIRESAGQGDVTDSGAALSFRRTGGRGGGDWFASRSDLRHTLRTVVPTRARIEQIDTAGSGGAPVVQSTVPVTLRDFRYRDDKEQLWLAAELPPGQRISLRRAPAPGDGNLKRGEFTAIGGASDFAPVPTLDSIRWQSDDVIYTGKIEKPEPLKN
ncbi:hypothetical protein OpiT1DRAFT_00409 [Opitutaceae bacterium TAV1]|nr:hypothetical protein OpiT1DRAFT_00409 [Opitutaceae bacterium TAV1]